MVHYQNYVSNCEQVLGGGGYERGQAGHVGLGLLTTYCIEYPVGDSQKRVGMLVENVKIDP